ncbi:MAG: glycine cleavage system aminomethyltransferase GcvT [Clostridiaceae bacterium]|nr:glycine cleavage system aminomethyltransferase GcvT [Clostridiaceae bacterium]
MKTPLYETHLRYGGRIVDFAGWELPVQFSGVIAEHKAVREACGLFDVSHMGELVLTGTDVFANLDFLLPNSYADMPALSCRYSPMCTPDGGIVDDIIVYKFTDTYVMIVVNASNTQKDADWIAAHLSGDAVLQNISPYMAQLAVQGPLALSVLSKLCDQSLLPVKNYTFAQRIPVAGIPCLVSRTGYTGEDGFELYLSPADAPALWDALVNAGALPCGLGARDTLRLEAAMPLYGHELSDTISPLEAGLSRFVRLDKPDFIGKDAIAARGAPRRRIGLHITGRGIAREGFPVTANDTEIGHVTSGTHCPTLGGAYAMALVDAAFTAPGTTLQVIIREKPVDAVVVKLPFYKRSRK